MPHVTIKLTEAENQKVIAKQNELRDPRTGKAPTKESIIKKYATNIFQ